MVGNQVKFILLKEIGNAYIYRELTDEQITKMYTPNRAAGKWN